MPGFGILIDSLLLCLTGRTIWNRINMHRIDFNSPSRSFHSPSDNEYKSFPSDGFKDFPPTFPLTISKTKDGEFHRVLKISEYYYLLVHNLIFSSSHHVPCADTKFIIKSVVNTAFAYAENSNVLYGNATRIFL